MVRFALLLAGALVAGTLLSPRPAAADDSAAALLAKHKAYVGWEFGDGTFKTLRLHERWTRNGLSDDETLATLTVVEAGPIYRAETADRDGSVSEQGFTGNVFWESDDNGFTRPDYSDYRNFVIARYAVLNEGTSSLVGTLENPATIDGTSYPVVRVKPPNGDAIDLYVDPRTGAYQRAVVDPGGPYETTYDIVGYTDVAPGKRYVSGYRVHGGTYTITKIEPNVELQPDDFHPPAPRATWNFANPAPFRLEVKPHAIFVDATVNGVAGHFILDTGASTIFLNNEFADKAHLQTIKPETLSGRGIGPDPIKMRIRRAATITIGGNTLSNVIVTTSRFDWIMDDERADGLIGFPLMAGAIVSINTSDKLMTISDPATTTIDQSSGIPIRVDLSGTLPIVPMVIDGRVTVNALLDSGDGSTVAMSPQLVSKRHIPMLASNNVYLSQGDPDSSTAVENYVQSHIMVTGVGGQELESCSTVSSISLGPINYQGTYACTSPSITGDNIIVGYDFLKNFDLLFDYHDGLLMLKPHAP
jgi:Aspartyl protease